MKVVQRSDDVALRRATGTLKSVYAIAKRLGWSPSTVRRQAARLKLELPRGKRYGGKRKGYKTPVPVAPHGPTVVGAATVEVPAVTTTAPSPAPSLPDSDKLLKFFQAVDGAGLTLKEAIDIALAVRSAPHGTWHTWHFTHLDLNTPTTHLDLRTPMTGTTD